jgi:hypothetical protein
MRALGGLESLAAPLLPAPPGTPVAPRPIMCGQVCRTHCSLPSSSPSTARCRGTWGLQPRRCTTCGQIRHPGRRPALVFQQAARGPGPAKAGSAAALAAAARADTAGRLGPWPPAPWFPCSSRPCTGGWSTSGSPATGGLAPPARWPGDQLGGPRPRPLAFCCGQPAALCVPHESGITGPRVEVTSANAARNSRYSRSDATQGDQI